MTEGMMLVRPGPRNKNDGCCNGGRDWNLGLWSRVEDWWQVEWGYGARWGYGVGVSGEAAGGQRARVLQGEFRRHQR